MAGARPNRQNRPDATSLRAQPVSSARNFSENREAVVRVTSADELPWSSRLQQWIRGFSARGYAMSCIVHFIILLMASLVILQDVDNEPISTLVSASENDLGDLDLALDTRIEVEDDVHEVAELQQLDLADSFEPTAPEFPEDFAATQPIGIDKDASDAPKNRAVYPFAKPASGKVVTKGNFTAWTVPEDPAPREDYRIIIQIKLPKKLRRYPLWDLLGRIVGTDGYIQEFPEYHKTYLPVKDNQAQLVVLVPGAERLVRDTIEVRSLKILKEKQTLNIEF